MIVAEMLVALIVGVVVVSLVAFVFRRPGPWTRPGTGSGFLWFLLVVFLGAWAIGTWTTPVGPVVWGVSWVPFVFGALAIALLLAALSAPRPATRTEAVTATATETVLGAFFWAFVLVLIVAILMGLA